MTTTRKRLSGNPAKRAAQVAASSPRSVPAPVTRTAPPADEIEWAGTGWRIWRVKRVKGRVLLLNPWQNSGREYLWEPGRVESAECFLGEQLAGELKKLERLREQTKGNRAALTAVHDRAPELLDRLPELRAQVAKGCLGLVSASCTCGIRVMASLRDLGTWLDGDATIERHPAKASVVGRVRFGGRVQHSMPAAERPMSGYNRAEYAEIVGPLYVSPLTVPGAWARSIAEAYGEVAEVVGPDHIRDVDTQRDWLEELAEREAR